MPKKEKKYSINILIEGTGGELIFKKIKENKHDLKKIIEENKNPVIKNNVFKTGSGKKVKV